MNTKPGTTVLATDEAKAAERQTIRRRGLVAGAAALVAAAAVKSTSEPVAAISLQPFLLGIINDADLILLPFTTSGIIGTLAGGPIFSVVNRSTAVGSAILGTGTGNGIGVQGVGGNGAGVVGSSTSGNGVYGSSNGNVAVYGVNNGGPYPYGVVGAVTAAPGFGLVGVASVSGTVGFGGSAAVNGAIAGQFSGPVNIYNNGAIAPGNLYVQGNQTIAGTKSAAVPHPDGTHRLLYCMESPEAWFEDFGTGTLSSGKAEVKLDADFAAVVDTKDLHVFLTPHDEAHHLAVKTASGSGFSVAASVSADASARGMKATDANGTFTYRVVAKRKDVQADRLAKFTVPQEIKASVPPIPKFATPAPAQKG